MTSGLVFWTIQYFQKGGYELILYFKSRLHVLMCFEGLPQPGKNIWKMKFFPGQGKVREFCRWPGKFRKDLESQ